MRTATCVPQLWRARPQLSVLRAGLLHLPLTPDLPHRFLSISCKPPGKSMRLHEHRMLMLSDRELTALVQLDVP